MGNSAEITFFTTHPLSIQIDKKSIELSFSEKIMIGLATVAGLGIASVFTFFAASYYFRNRKVQQLDLENNHKLLPINSLACNIHKSTVAEPLKTQLESTPPSKPPKSPEKVDEIAEVVTPTTNDAIDSLKLKFEKKMSEFGRHLHEFQKTILLKLFDDAMQSTQPQKVFAEGIEINIPNIWIEAKAVFLRKELTPLLPITNSSVKSPPVGVLSEKRGEDSRVNIVSNIARKDQVVCFYKTGPTSFLGNFERCPQQLQLWGNTFKCAEAAFQWRKYNLAAKNNTRLDLLSDPRLQQFFACDGEEAFRLNRQLGIDYPKVFAHQWLKGTRDEVMWEVLKEKFNKNPDLQQLLRATAGAYLLEHNEAPRDNYWSDNADGTGKNMLGRMLMALRDGKGCPPVDDTSDHAKMQQFTAFANQPGNLDYDIF